MLNILALMLSGWMVLFAIGAVAAIYIVGRTERLELGIAPMIVGLAIVVPALLMGGYLVLNFVEDSSTLNQCLSSLARL
jgi:hypothetical protein